jgi:hypothetical protein
MPYRTRREVSFDRYQRYDVGEDGRFCECREQGWLLLVHRRYVVHRDDVDRMEARRRQLSQAGGEQR